MNFKKKIYSRHRVSNIVGLILLLIILCILLESGFNLVNDSENEYKKSSSAFQSKMKINLPDEKKSFEYKKNKDLVFPGKDLDAQNKNEKDILNENTKQNKNIEESKINKKKDKLSLNLKTKKSDSPKAFDDPIMTVNFLHEGLKKISSNNNSELKNVLQVINRTYDAEKMLKMIIGADWKNQKNEKKKELIIIFKEYISKNYLKRFSKINDVSFRNEKKEKISSELFLVRSNIIIKQEKISMDYLLSLQNNVWKIL